MPQFTINGPGAPSFTLTKEKVEEVLEYTPADSTDLSALTEEVSKKADKSDLDAYTNTEDLKALLEEKADLSKLDEYTNTETLEQKLDLKADKTALDSYTTTEELNSLLDAKANASDLDNYVLNETYTSEMADKANRSELDAYATNEALTSGLQTKADSAEVEKTYATKEELAQAEIGADTTLAGYAKTDYVDEQIATRAEASVVEELSQQVAGKADSKTIEETYAKKSDIASAVRYKASVENLEELQALKESAQAGDLYNVSESDMNYVFNGTDFDAMAPMLDLSGYALQEKVDAEIEKVNTAVKEVETGLETKADKDHSHYATEILFNDEESLQNKLDQGKLGSGGGSGSGDPSIPVIPAEQALDVKKLSETAIDLFLPWTWTFEIKADQWSEGKGDFPYYHAYETVWRIPRLSHYIEILTNSYPASGTEEELLNKIERLSNIDKGTLTFDTYVSPAGDATFYINGEIYCQGEYTGTELEGMGLTGFNADSSYLLFTAQSQPECDMPIHVTETLSTSRDIGEEIQKFVEVVWKNFDGTVIDKTQVLVGQVPEHEEPKYDIPFTGWSPELGVVHGPMVYTAQYELPTGMSQTITKTWDQIIQDAEDENINGYNELDTKMIFTKDGKALCYELAGIRKDKDMIFTFVPKTIYGLSQRNDVSFNTGSYPNSVYKKYIETNCIPNMPDNIQNAAKEIERYAHSYSPDQSDFSYLAKFWPLSVYNFGYPTDKYETKGPVYTAYTDNSQRIRYNNLGEPIRAWLSSDAYNSNTTCAVVDNYGATTNCNCGESHGALPCFCLGSSHPTPDIPEEPKEKVTITWKNFDGSIIDQTEVGKGLMPEHEDPKYDIPFDKWTPDLKTAREAAEYTATYILPVGMSQTISKTWDEIIQDAQDENAEGYQELDTKMVFTKDGKALCYELAGIKKDKDMIFTFIPRTVYGTYRRTNLSYNTGSYPNSQLREYIEQICVPNLPDNIQKAAKEVIKTSCTYKPKQTDMEYAVRFWIPSTREMNFSTVNYEKSGPIYTCYSDLSKRIRYDSKGYPVNAWLSSDTYNSESQAQAIETYGQFVSKSVGESHGVLPCFCLGADEPTPEIPVEPDVTYTITWKNFDGSIIDEVEAAEGEMPIHDDPQYDIPFVKWTPEIKEATEPATYTATYDLPVGMSQTIEKSWDEIIDDAQSGTIDGYSELDTKMVFTKDGKALCYELAGIQKDEGATFSFIPVTVDGLVQYHTLNANNGSFSSVAYRGTLNYKCAATLPDNIQSAVIEVDKICHSYVPDVTNMKYRTKYWAPSVREMNYDTANYENEGVQYTCYKKNEQRIRYDNEGRPCYSWLSSAAYNVDSQALSINIYGHFTAVNCTESHGALPAFCLGPKEE